MGWKSLFGSAVGSSHLADRNPYQDACGACSSIEGWPECFVATCADGAGSACFGKEGAELVVAAVIEQCSHSFFLSAPPSEVEFEVLRILREIQSAIQKVAESMNTTSRDFACTLLVVIQRMDDLICVQLGDGAIVIQRDGVNGVAFWPMGGEYAGTTYFVTEVSAADNIQINVTAGQVERIAMFTDGLERLALDFSKQVPHLPFVKPLWEQLQAVECEDELRDPMIAFLQSPQVTSRTDDDKTLVLIVRS